MATSHAGLLLEMEGKLFTDGLGWRFIQSVTLMKIPNLLISDVVVRSGMLLKRPALMFPSMGNSILVISLSHSMKRLISIE